MRGAYQVTVKRIGSHAQPTTFTGEGARAASQQFYMQELERKDDLEEITREVGMVNESTQEFEAHSHYEHYKSKKQPPARKPVEEDDMDHTYW